MFFREGRKAVKNPQKANMNIYVGNMPYSMTDSDLNDAFAAYGKVDSARVVMDRDSGRPKGFGFVEMPNNDEANAAIAALNGTQRDGRALSVNEARPKEDRPQRNSGGNRGGRRW